MMAQRGIRRLSIAAVVVLGWGASWSAAVEIIGHRGASHDAPENTLGSIRLAWKQQADAAEIDVYLSKDGQIVTIHDDDTKRIGGRPIKVVDQTLAELKQLDMGSWKGPQWAGERIPTLAEVIATIPDGKRLFIEVKCGPEIASKLAAVLKSSGKRPEQTCIISFSYDVVARMKREVPETKCYLIVEFKQDPQTKQWSPSVDSLIARAREARLDGIDFGNAPVVDADAIATLKRAGLGAYVWTVDRVEDADRLERAGVDGITTNRPGFLKEHFRTAR